MSTNRVHSSLHTSVVAALVTLVSSMAFSSHSEAGTKTLVRLEGPVIVTAVSGKKGTQHTLGTPNSDTHGIWRLASEETGAFTNVPCLLRVGGEDLDDAASDRTWLKDLCKDKKTGHLIEVAYPDTSWAGSRVFVSGVSVCLNRDRVKGLKLRGRAITDDGTLVDLEQWQSIVRPAAGGETRTSGITEPRDQRPNCGTWMAWAECPYSMLATAVVAHFESGAEPRSLKGIALQCRAVVSSGLGWTRS